MKQRKEKKGLESKLNATTERGGEEKKRGKCGMF